MSLPDEGPVQISPSLQSLPCLFEKLSLSSRQLGYDVGRLPGPAHVTPHFSFRCSLNIEAVLQGRTVCHLGVLSAHIAPGPKKALRKWIVCFRGWWGNNTSLPTFPVYTNRVYSCGSECFVSYCRLNECVLRRESRKISSFQNL